MKITGPKTSLLALLLLSLNAFGTEKAAVSCMDLLVSSALDKGRVSLIEYNNVPGVQPLIYYEGERRLSRHSTTIPVLSAGKTSFDLSNAIVERNHLPRFQRLKRVQAIKYQGKQLLLDVKSQTLTGQASSQSPRYDLHWFSGALEITSNTQGVYVLVDNPNSTSLYELRIPKSLPPRTSVFNKIIKLPLGVSRPFIPTMIGYGPYLILGGTELAILNTYDGVYASLKMQDDYGHNPIVALQKRKDGTISVIRRIQDPNPKDSPPPEFYQNGFYYVEYVIDLRRLTLPKR